MGWSWKNIFGRKLVLTVFSTWLHLWAEAFRQLPPALHHITHFLMYPRKVPPFPIQKNGCILTTNLQHIFLTRGQGGQNSLIWLEIVNADKFQRELHSIFNPICVESFLFSFPLIFLTLTTNMWCRMMNSISWQWDAKLKLLSVQKIDFLVQNSLIHFERVVEITGSEKIQTLCESILKHLPVKPHNNS